MRVAFLNPPWCFDDKPELWGVRAGSRWPHMQRRAGKGLPPRYIPFPFMLSIAAAATKRIGHEVLLIDGVAEGITLEEMRGRVTDFKPVIIFMETSTPSLTYDLKVAELMEKIHPRPTMIMGGLHAASLIKDMIGASILPEAWIAGEYDLSVAAISQAVLGKARLADVPGLSMASGKVTNPPARIDNVDDLPQPLYEQLPMKRYSDPVCGLPSPVGHSWTSPWVPFRLLVLCLASDSLRRQALPPAAH